MLSKYLLRVLSALTVAYGVPTLANDEQWRIVVQHVDAQDLARTPQPKRALRRIR